jgi:hypothetical protein
VITLVLCVLILALFLFKRRTYEDDYWGRMTVVTEWGFEREVRMDRDLDGRPDIRIRYPRAWRRISHHDRPSEMLIDDDLNGEFDIRWCDGSVPVLEYKRPNGRTYVIRGSAADIPNDRIKLRGREELGL